MANNKDFKVKNGIQPTVYNEGVGTVVSGSEGYYLAGASYDSVSFDVSSQSPYMFDFGFADSGTKMYAQNQFNGGTIFQYTLSTAYDISTASYASKSYSFANGESGFVITPNGSHLYISDNTGDAVYRYTFGTAFDVSTLSSGTQMFSTSSVDTQPDKCRFNDDGSKFFLLGRANNRIYEYAVSTAYDLSTATYSNNSLLVSSQATAPLGFDFNSDGTKLIVSDNTTDSVYLYNLSTGFDITTASYSSTSFSLASQDSVPSGVSFNTSGSKMFVLGNVNDTIYQYSTVLNTASLDLSTGAVFDYTPTSDVQVTVSNPAASGTVSSATLLLTGGAAEGGVLSAASYTSKSFDYSAVTTGEYGMGFSNNGSYLYIPDQGSNTIYQFSLSTAWDISTASYDSISYNASSQVSSPRDVAFNDDGTIMYVGDQGNNGIYQYTLSTAYDISSASYANKSLSTASQDAQFRDMWFKPDGTKVYTYGDTNVRVYQFALSTAWDISTASYESKFFSPSTQVPTAQKFALNSSGTKFYMMGYSSSQGIFQYSLSTAWDISTASYDSVNYTGYTTETGTDNNEYGFYISDDDVNMYILDRTGHKIFQYTIANGAAITYDTNLQWSGGTTPASPAVGETDVITISTRDGGTTYQAVQAIDGAK